MPVALLPPVTSGSHRTPGSVPLTEGPRYVRGPRNGRWHRPRAAIWLPEPRTVWVLWCGPALYDRPADPALRVDEVPAGEQVCGTCVGRSMGAGQDETPTGLPALVFSPRWQVPPTYCPGSRSDLYELVGRSVGRCLACGEMEPVRAMGGPWYGRVGIRQHSPGAGLLPGCPFHAWQHVRRRPSGAAGCVCGWHDEPPAEGGEGR